MKVAFLKFDGLGFGGTERWMQSLARELSTRGVQIDYFSCSTFGLTLNDDEDRLKRRDRLQHAGVNVVECKMDRRNLKYRHHPWEGTDLWQFFDPSRYDIVQAGKAGHPEYPFTEWTIPNVVEFRSLDARVDTSQSVTWSVHLSEYQRRLWLRRGGVLTRSSVIPIPVDLPDTKEDLRDELGIPRGALVIGFHQRNDDRIWSSIPLRAYKRIESPDTFFLLLGGSAKYSNQARDLGLQRFMQLKHSGSDERISRFLNSVDVFAHGRADGETFGSVLAEAMSRGKPCISHRVPRGANAQPETMGPGGFFAVDAEDYTQMLRNLIDSTDLRARVGNAGQHHAATHYSRESAAGGLYACYEHTLYGQSSSSLELLPASPQLRESATQHIARGRAMVSHFLDEQSYSRYKRKLSRQQEPS